MLNKTFIYREVGRKGYNLSINLAKVFTQDVLAHSGIYFNCNITSKKKKIGTENLQLQVTYLRCTSCAYLNLRVRVNPANY